MMLSIIVTHYKEPWNTVKPLFDSLALQRGIDWKNIEILLVQDGEEGALERSHFISYGLPIKMHTIEHGGVAKARNYGLNSAEGAYVMFCDCDDMFCQAFGLNMFITAMKDKPDVISCSFIEESDYKEYHLFRHENDMCFVHGKAFRTQYLYDAGIMFPVHIKKHEDGAMVRLAFLLTDKQIYISTPIYTWVWNPTSVMRIGGVDNELVESYPELMKSRLYFLDQLAIRHMDDELKTQTAKIVFDCFYDFQKDEFVDPKNTELVQRDAKAFAEIYKKYKDVYLSNDARELAKLANKARSEAYSNGMLMEHMTIGQFLGTIEQM